MAAVERDIFNEDTARRFWKEQRQRVKNAEPAESIDFSGMAFPEDPDGLYFHGIGFLAHADFSGAIFTTEKVFQKTRFHDDVIFENASFPAGCIMTETIFESNASFSSTMFDKHVYIAAEFRGDASFSEAVFKKEAIFGNGIGFSIFKGPALFTGVSFETLAEFEGVEFERTADFRNACFKYWTQFNGTIFNGIARFENAKFTRCSGQREKRRNLVKFRNVKFQDKVSFCSIVFDCKATFQNVFFHADADFRGTRFGDRAGFDTCIVESRLLLDESYKQMFSNPEDAIVPYRLAKQAAADCGDSRWTGNYHFQEQCATNAKRRKDSTFRFWTGRFWHKDANAILNYGEFLLGRCLFGYGEKPLRPLVAGAFVVLVCSFLFWTFNGIDHNPPCSFLSSLYFSVVTFTTLGYGDLQPTPSMRWLSGTEAFLGAALMAMFIVTLARKFTR